MSFCVARPMSKRFLLIPQVLCREFSRASPALDAFEVGFNFVPPGVRSRNATKYVNKNNAYDSSIYVSWFQLRRS